MSDEHSKEPDNVEEKPMEMSIHTSIQSLTSFIKTTQEIIEQAERMISENGLKHLIEKQLGTLIQMMHNYKQLLSSMNCQNMKELLLILQELSLKEKACNSKKQVGSEIDFQDLIEEFFQSEKSWDEFLQNLDRQLDSSSSFKNSSLPDDSYGSYELEKLESSDTKAVSLGTIISTRKFTWAIFLRHYS